MNRDWLPIKTTPWTMGLILCALLLLIQASALPERLNLWLFDTVSTAVPATPSDDVAIVAVDELSLDRLGRWPWQRSIHAELIRKLDAAGAHTIVFDILFPETSPDDAELAKAMLSHGRVVLPVHLSPPTTNYLLREQLPAPQLASAAAGIGHAARRRRGVDLARRSRRSAGRCRSVCR